MYGVKWYVASGKWGPHRSFGESKARRLLSHHAVCKHLFYSEGCIKMSVRTRVGIGPKRLEFGTSRGVGESDCHVMARHSPGERWVREH
jgi:hypothetical protein